MTMESGSVLGGFTIGEVIASGGFATVYLGVHNVYGTQAAVKVLHAVNDGDFHELNRDFIQEIQAVASLNHPRITSIYDYGSSVIKGQRVLWLAMELVKGGTVKSKISNVQWGELSQILLDVLDGLGHAHARRLIHLDIKPRNLLYDASSNRIKLTDFGLMRSFEYDALTHSTETEIVGTPYYMAPEQIRCDLLAYGPWTDLYAVGCLAWEMMCGKPPYQGDYTTVFQQHLAGVLPEFNPKMPVPHQVIVWLKRLLNPNINERYQHVSQAVEDLNRLLIGDSLGDVHTLNSTVPTESVDAWDDLPTAAFGEVLHTVDTDLGDTTLELPSASKGHGVVGYTTEQVYPTLPNNWRRKKEASLNKQGIGLKLFQMQTRRVIGRDRVRDSMWNWCLAAFVHRSPRLVMLEGASGVGKNTLATWLAHRADELGGAQWLSVAFDGSQNNRSLFGHTIGQALRVVHLPTSEALQRIEGILSQMDCDGITAKDLMNLCFNVGGFAELEFDVWSSILIQYLVTLSKVRPIVLVLQGCQYEPQLAQLLHRILEYKKDFPICVVGTITFSAVQFDKKIPLLFQSIHEHSRSTLLQVEALSSTEFSIFLQELLELDRESAATLEQFSHGNPDIAVQILNIWVQKGYLNITSSGFRLSDQAPIELPKTLLDAWVQQYLVLVEEFSTNDLLTLEMGAILGVTVSPTEWEKALSLLGLSINFDFLLDIQHRRLIDFDPTDGQWSFSHALLREAILQHLSKTGKRAELSRVALGVIEDTNINLPRRARLYVDSNSPLEALEPLYRASVYYVMGDEVGQAQHLSSMRESILADLNVDSQSIHSLQSKLLDLFLSDANEQETVLLDPSNHLFEWATQMEDWESVLYLYRKKSVFLYHNGEVSEAVKLMKKSLKIARTHRSPSVMNILTRLSYFVRDPDRSIRYARKAIIAAETHRDFAKIGNAYLHLATGLKRQGNYSQALFALEEAEHRFRHVNHRSGLPPILHLRGEIYRILKDYQRAEQSYIQELEMSVHLGQDGFNHLINLVNLLITYFLMERNAEAWDVGQRIWTLVGPTSTSSLPKVTRLIGLLCLAPCQAQQQNWSALKETLEGIDVGLEEFQFIDQDVYTLLIACLNHCTESSIQNHLEAILEAQCQREGLELGFWRKDTTVP